MGTNLIDFRSEIPKYKGNQLYNVATGLITFIEETENELSDPEVFIIISKTADIREYGFKHEASSNGSGAGISYEKAYKAAIGEAAERYALSVIHPEDLIFDSYESMIANGLVALGPETFKLFDSSQLKVIPYPEFTNKTKVAWVLADSITEKKSKYIPACLNYIPYPLHFKEKGEGIIANAVSTGCATSYNLKDAIFRGILELIERDAFMIFWRNQLPCPKVVIDESSEIFEIFKSKFERPGLKYEIFETTMDLEIPSFFGVLTDTRGDSIGRVVGGACNPNPTIAVLKTLEEMVQGLKWKDHKESTEMKSFPIVEDFSNIRSFENRMELYSFNELNEAFNFLSSSNVISLSSLEKKYCSFRHTLNSVTELFIKNGYEILVIDLTPMEVKDSNMFVARVIIPQLEVMDGDHLYQFLGGKRWKTVPKKMGYRKSESTLIDINPFPHPYP